MGGRLNAITLAERICAPMPNTRPISAVICVCAAVLSAKALSRTNMKPLFGSCALSRIEKPTMAKRVGDTRASS